jgi:hypothetical protein
VPEKKLGRVSTAIGGRSREVRSPTKTYASLLKADASDRPVVAGSRRSERPLWPVRHKGQAPFHIIGSQTARQRDVGARGGPVARVPVRPTPLCGPHEVRPHARVDLDANPVLTVKETRTVCEIAWRAGHVIEDGHQRKPFNRDMWISPPTAVSTLNG